eukprot:4382065-Amphidinium_carterae.1
MDYLREGDLRPPRGGVRRRSFTGAVAHQKSNFPRNITKYVCIFVYTVYMHSATSHICNRSLDTFPTRSLNCKKA